MTKKEEQAREQSIQAVANMLRETAFKVEFAVTPEPKGITITVEVTKEQLKQVMEQAQKGA